MKKILLLIALLISITSCKIQQVEYREVHTTDTIYQNHLLYDSIYVYESEKTRADTVYLTRETFKYKFKTDTLIAVRDSIQTVYETKIQTFQKPIPSVYKWSLGILIALIVAILSYIAVKIYLKFKI